MKIISIIQRYHPVIGGSENLTKNLMDFLEKFHEITVYTTTADEIQSFWYPQSKKIQKSSNLPYPVKNFDFLTPTEIKHDGFLEKIPIISSHPGPFSPELWRNLIFQNNDYDLLFVTSFPYDHIIPAYFSAKKWKKPIVCMPLIHQEFPELFLNSQKLTMLNNFDAIIALSTSEKNLLEELGIDPKKIFVIPPTIIPSQIKPNPDNFKIKKLRGFSGKIILFIGSKSTMKGIMHLIDAMKLVWKQREDVKLILIGPSSSEFEEFFSKLSPKIKENIIDLGVVNEEEKNNALSSCDIFVLPSKSESFGLVYIEAWLHRKPVIGCNLPSVEEVIEHKKNGLLTEYGNIQDLGNAITFLINNPQECKKFGDQGNSKAMLYTSEKNFKKFETVLINLLSN
jgi:glycosyltransferase involved in cell wall biosynthesis